MQNRTVVRILLIFALVFTTANLSAKESEKEGNGDLKTEIKEFIDHHLQDSHDFTLFSDKEANKHYGFPLPVILWDNGVKVFSSSKFHHGETVAEVDGNFYKLYHSKIYKTDAAGTINYDDHHHATNAKPLELAY